MKLTALQAYNIEKALIKGQTIEAVRLYREATQCDLAEAKAEVDKITAELKEQKPWHFKGQTAEAVPPEKKPFKLGKGFLALFLLVDGLVFGAIAYFFVLRVDSPEPRALTEAVRSVATGSPASQSEGRPKILLLPSHPDADSYTAELDSDEDFHSLYQRKIKSFSYIRRKNGSSRDFDGSKLEKKIKTARSQLALQRVAPPGISPTLIAGSVNQPVLDGVMGAAEWASATSVVVDEALGTKLYLQTDGQWLFIACDAPAETTAKGYDQLRVYFHAGLVDQLVNERIHIGRKPGLTSIRQTGFRWQGAPPKDEDERWKRFSISDWGLYRYARGTSSMVAGHRQYEAAIHLGEAALHPGVPFTLYAEIETDPLKNAQGKFVERQYLGELGDANNPKWMVF